MFLSFQSVVQCVTELLLPEFCWESWEVLEFRNLLRMGAQCCLWPWPKLLDGVADALRTRHAHGSPVCSSYQPHHQTMSMTQALYTNINQEDEVCLTFYCRSFLTWHTLYIDSCRRFIQFPCWSFVSIAPGLLERELHQDECQACTVRWRQGRGMAFGRETCIDIWNNVVTLHHQIFGKLFELRLCKCKKVSITFGDQVISSSDFSPSCKHGSRCWILWQQVFWIIQYGGWRGRLPVRYLSTYKIRFGGLVRFGQRICCFFPPPLAGRRVAWTHSSVMCWKQVTRRFSMQALCCFASMTYCVFAMRCTLVYLLHTHVYHKLLYNT